MRKFLVLMAVFGVLAALLVTQAWATTSPITNPFALGASMSSVDWGSLGGSGTDVSNPFTLGSITVSMPSGTFLRVDQGTDWDGNFNPGDHLLWTYFNPGPMSLIFSAPVYGAGTQVQPEYLGAFMVQAEAFSGLTSLGSFNLAGVSTDADDGTAPFWGIMSDIAFDRITFSIEDPAGKDFAMNILKIQTNPPSAVPIPPSALLLGSALLSLGAWQRWRNR